MNVQKNNTLLVALLLFFSISCSNFLSTEKASDQNTSFLDQSFTPDEYSEELAISGGEQTDDHPYMAALFFPSGASCGASLIDQQWALTAAHCIPKNKKTKLYLRIGSKYRKKGTRVNVSQTIVHPKYKLATSSTLKDLSNMHDIALIKLDKKMTHLKPISIATSSRYDSTGMYTKILGWGTSLWKTNKTTKRPNEDVLRSLTTKITAQYGTILENQDRYYNSFNAIQSGDSGGPLISWDGNGNERLIGVASFLWTQSQKTTSNYTRVSLFSSWISQTIKNNTSKKKEAPAEEKKPVQTKTPASSYKNTWIGSVMTKGKESFEHKELGEFLADQFQENNSQNQQVFIYLKKLNINYMTKPKYKKVKSDGTTQGIWMKNPKNNSWDYFYFNYNNKTYIYNSTSKKWSRYP